MASTQPDPDVSPTGLTIFIGSSSKGRRVAYAIQANLGRDGYQVVVWDQGVFVPGETTIDALTAVASTYDFAILVVTPDDVVESGGTVQPSPRDNVILETGLFIGALGRQRTFLVVDSAARPKLPSDLAGVTYAGYSPPPGSPTQLTAVALQPSLNPACIAIEDAMTRRGPRTVVGPIPRDSWRHLVDILVFAKNMHTSFQALDTSHLDSLTQTVYDLVNPGVSQEFRLRKKMDGDQAWNQYSALFISYAKPFDQLLQPKGWDSLDLSFRVLDGSLPPDARTQIESCRRFFSSVKELLPQFMSAHDSASSMLQQKGLVNRFDTPGQDAELWVQLDRLSKVSKSLITQADAMIVNIVNLISR